MVFEMKFSSDIYRIILYYKHSAVMRHKTCGSCEETFYFPTLFRMILIVVRGIYMLCLSIIYTSTYLRVYRL